MNNFGKFCIGGGRMLISKTNSGNVVVPYQALIRQFKSTPFNRISMRNRVNKMRPTEQRTPGNSSVTLDAGRIAVMGAAAVGLGGLCYHGIYGSQTNSISSQSLSALDRTVVWPDYVRHRIRSVYSYLAGGAAIAGASAVKLAQSPAFVRLMTAGWMGPIGMLVASVGAGVVCQMIPYPADGGKFNTKHLSWLVYAASLGGVFTPVCLIGGPILTRALVYTGGIVGGLSLVAASAPSDRFLYWGGPLAMGLGVVFVSSLGSMFMSPVSRLGAGMAAVSLYGGLVLFSGFLLYDTQMVIHRAEQHPPPLEYPYGGGVRGMQEIRPFDPISSSIHILLDTLNILVRMVAIMSGQQRRK